ncbi:hypothetical protein [Mycoplasma sp. 125]|uniref:hypothetical protein n=1 Tax=Mycoplasma sp. 125 TaxID=3447505 RepID=UPI003F65CABE
MKKSKALKFSLLGLGTTLIAPLPILSISCWAFEDINKMPRPNKPTPGLGPKPKPNNPGETKPAPNTNGLNIKPLPLPKTEEQQGNSNTLTQDIEKIEKQMNIADEARRAQWEKQNAMEYSTRLSEGNSPDELFAYAMNLASLTNDNGQKITSDEFDTRLKSLRDEVEKAYENAITTFHRDLERVFIGAEIYDTYHNSDLAKQTKESQENLYGTEINGQTMPEIAFREAKWKNNISWWEYNTNYRLFSKSRIKNNDKDFKNLSEDTKKAIEKLNEKIWGWNKILNPINKRKELAETTLRFLRVYLELLAALKQDVKNPDESFKQQLSAETQQKISFLYAQTIEFISPYNYWFLELDENGKTKNWFFDQPDGDRHYDPAWVFNKVLKLINEFVFPLRWMQYEEKIPYWEDDLIRWRHIYSKYLFNKWDDAGQIQIGELYKPATQQEAYGRLEKWLAHNNYGLDLKYDGLIESKKDKEAKQE